MALDPALRKRLTLPAVCAPMFLVTGPELVAEACKAGLVGALPRQNARGIETFEQWLKQIRQSIDEFGSLTVRGCGRSLSWTVSRNLS